MTKKNQQSNGDLFYFLSSSTTHVVTRLHLSSAAMYLDIGKTRRGQEDQ